MKRFSLFIFFALFLQQVNAIANAQGITISVKDASLDKVFPLIQKQTKRVIVYVDSQLANAKRVTIDVTDEKIEKVLDLILKDQPLVYSINGEFIVIKSKKVGPKQTIKENIQELPGELTGRVIDEKGVPVIGATIMVKGTDIITLSGADGYFTIKGVDNKAILSVTSVGYEPKIVKLSGTEKIEIKMVVSAQVIKEVIVKGNTGYQVIDKDHPGSFDVVDNALLNRRVSSNIIDRIENLTTGLSFGTPYEKTPDNPSGILIRGRNSIFSSVGPLIVVDNFPYDGDLNNINPNDVESVTILKDAAATAQWGAKAGNGVIIITTKRGKSGKPLVTYNSNVTFGMKPDLYNLPIISSSEEIEVEKWLFGKGYYDDAIADNYYNPPLTPVQELLLKQRNNEISAEEANAQINKMKSADFRSDLLKYFYKTSRNLQNSISVSGSNSGISYFLSAGWDNNLSNLVGTTDNRFTLRSQNTFRVTNNFQIDVGLNYVNSSSKFGNNPGINIAPGAGKQLYPYADLVDPNGIANVLVKDYRAGYIDTLGYGKVLDWHYKPYDDIYYTDGKSASNDFVINTGFRYTFSKSLNIDIKYQYENSTNNTNSVSKVESYYTRDLINRYYQPDAINKFPIPIGGIGTNNYSSINSHQGRAQLNYSQTFDEGTHKISGIAGFEIKSLQNKAEGNTVYGYSRKGSIINQKMNFDVPYDLFTTYYTYPTPAFIYNSQTTSERLDRFISYYFNGMYTYKGKYTLSASARKDAANLFGVGANQRGVPLWSSGVSWKISDESFYQVNWLSRLILKGTYGYSGNYSRTASALTTASYGLNNFGATAATIINPPNGNLRWEKVATLNFGLDFASKNDRIAGTIEYYRKKNTDLLGFGPIDPTTGLTLGNGRAFFLGNLASMKGSGVEVNLSSQNLKGKIRWESNVLFTYALNKVSDYLLPPPQLPTSYIGATNLTPIIGKPVFNHYAFKWMGLESSTGDPQGYLDGKISKDYDAILNNTKIDSLVYIGTAQPKYFGALRNTFTWKGLSLSFNISYKMGYYFKRNSISYMGLYSSWSGHKDFSKRWQKPGDELTTNIPSQVYIDYPQFSSRETFYNYSEVLIEKGDHIRLEDVGVNYTIDKRLMKALPFKQLRLYAYANNLNMILWKANKKGLDPSFNEGVIPGKSFSAGVNFEF